MIELTLEDFKYLSEKQALLDNAIMKEKEITKDDWLNDLNFNHHIALKVELSEFVNECIDLWKYWKDKDPNLERVLDEAIDVIHFVFLMLNKQEQIDINEMYSNYKETERYIASAIDEIKRSAELITELLNEDNVNVIMHMTLFILSHYGFTREHVINQYNKKNAINFERLENGY